MWTTTELYPGAKATVEQGEDFSIHHCPEHGEYRVPLEVVQEGDWRGYWCVPDDKTDECPVCGQYGEPLQESDPDAYWDARERNR